jgi:hypothetical protein
MIRKLITIVLPLLLPIILYFTWVWLARRQAAKNGTKESQGPREFPRCALGMARHRWAHIISGYSFGDAVDF